MTKATFIFAFRGLVRRPIQTSLILFALIAALAATLSLLAVLAGIREQVRRDLVQVGLDVINVHISPSLTNLFVSPLKLSDCDWMAETTHGTVAPFLATMGMTQVETEHDPVQALVLEVTPEWGTVVPLEWIEGRFLRPAEQNVCVLDEWVAKKLFPDSAATGRTIRVQRLGTAQTLRVVGVMKDPFEIRKRFDELDITATARSRVVRMMEFKSIYVPGRFVQPDQPIHGALVKVPTGSDPSVLAAALRRELGPRQDSVWVWSRMEWVGSVLQATDLITAIANVIWAIVLLVTGIMIMTVSLVAIRERYREIAIRRTEGGRRMQIVAQLLAENVILSALAGLVAVALAHGVGGVLEERYISWPPAFRPGDVALVLALGIVLAALSTILPAYRAASLDPVEVLRSG